MTTGVISNNLENALITHVLRNGEYPSPGTSIYIALFTDATAQDDDNSGTEVSGGNYARVQVTAWDAPTSGSTANTNAINFPTANASWGNVRYVGIMDDSSSGSLLFWGQLSSDKEVGNGDTFSIDAGDLDLYLGGAISFALSASLINHVLRDTAMTVSGSKVYAALYFDDPTQSDVGTEVSGGAGYSRENATDWFAPVSGSTGNSSVITFDAASEDWGEVTHVGIRNTESGDPGDLLFSGALDSSKTVGNGDTFRFSASALYITLD